MQVSGVTPGSSPSAYAQNVNIKFELRNPTKPSNILFDKLIVLYTEPNICTKYHILKKFELNPDTQIIILQFVCELIIKKTTDNFWDNCWHHLTICPPPNFMSDYDIIIKDYIMTW